MKVLLVGCGSIGKRHLDNLNSLAEVEHVFVYSKVKDCLNCLKDKSKVSFVESLNDAHVDLAIIANETYRHIDTALILAKKGIHLFIEKPLSHKLSNKLNLLQKIIVRNKIKFGVGYNLRLLGAFKFIKAKLAKRAIGDLYFARIEAGYYLPYWRKGRDYCFSYSASKERGGGVALDLSHEIDYMRYLFGDPRSWELAKTKVSNLKIDSEDIFEGVYKYDKFICQVHLDYLQKEKKRIIKIEGSRGMLMCDLINKEIIIEANGRKEVISDKRLFDLDRTYIDEISGFIKSIKKGRNFIATFDDGLKVLKLIKA